jgi:type II secretory pathway pseudopilin PulG
MRSFECPRRESGFTYLWTLMAVAMLGVGLATAAEIHSIATRREQERELIFIGHQFRAALRSYNHAQLRAGRREYPANLEELLKDNRFPGIRRHLRRIYKDPITGESEWGVVLVAGRIVGVHSLSQEHPLKQDGFEPDDAAFRGQERYSDWIFTYPTNALVGDSATANGLGQDGVGSVSPVQEEVRP